MCVCRERRRHRQAETEKHFAEEELRHQMRLRRQRAIRQFRQRQLHLMEILPAGNTHDHAFRLLLWVMLSINVFSQIVDFSFLSRNCKLDMPF